jgi:Flp pilus assembly protein TadG
MRAFALSDGGQSMILIAGGFAMLLAAVAVSVDWGYGFAQRRAMTNAAQAGALAAGRLLAGSVILSNGQARFPTHQEDVFTEACGFVRQDLGSPAAGSTYSLTVDFLASGASAPLASISRTITTTCPTFTSPYNTIDPSVRDLRLSATTTYSSLFGGVVGQTTITAGGAARSRIVGGAAIFNGGKPWPVVGHYDLASLNTSTCGDPCDPSTATPVTFWSNSVTYGASWKGQLDYSRCSTQQSSSSPSPCAPQLITAWDQSGSAFATPLTSPKVDVQSPQQCPSGSFDTAGAIPANAATDKSCGIPNWIYYGFQGTLSLCTNWVTTAGPIPTPCPASPTPTALPSHSPNPIGTGRTVCQSVPSFLIAPSCSNDRVGDWVETVTGSPVSTILQQAIHTFGVTTDFSNAAVPGGGGTLYGKALVVNAYLWDCAEELKSGSWNLVTPTPNPSPQDCSAVTASNWPNGRKADRVHLFTVSAFTFYEGLVDANNIKGFWGGGFASPDSCPANGNCALNSNNTTILVDP